MISVGIISLMTPMGTDGETTNLDDSLEAYYPIKYRNPGGSFYDFSGNGPHGYLYGNCKVVSNTKFGFALDMDGVDDYARTDAMTLNQDDLTLEAWIFWRGMKSGTSTWRQTIFSFETNFHVSLDSDGKLIFENGYKGSTPALTSSSSISTYEWTHIAVSRDDMGSGTNSVKIYINGILDAQGNCEELMTYSSQKSLYIGSYYSLSASTTDDYNGIIDEIKVFQSLLDNTDGIGRCVLKFGFELDDDSRHYSSTAIDRSGMENSGTIYGPIFQNVGVYSSRSLYFDGQNDYVYVPDDPSLRMQAFTISTYIKPDSVSTAHTNVISKRYDTSGPDYYSYGIKVHPGSDSSMFKVAAVMYAGSSNVECNSWTNGYEYSIDQWHHVSITWDGYNGAGTLKLYVDGFLVASATGTGTIPYNSNTLRIGRYSNNLYFNGNIDNVQIFNYVKKIGTEVLRLDCNNDVVDDSVYSNTVTTSSVSYSSTIKRYGSSLSLNGQNSRVDSTHGSEYELQEFTLEAWIYPDGEVDTFDNIISKRFPNSGYYSFGLRLKNKDADEYYVGGAISMSSTVKYEKWGSTALKINEWHHVAITWDGNEGNGDLKIYVDGYLDGSIAGSGKIQYSSSYPVRIGYYHTTSTYSELYFNGYVDNVMISSYAKSFLEDIDGDGMADNYENLRGLTSNQYNSLEYNGRYGLLVTPVIKNVHVQDKFQLREMYRYLIANGWCHEDIVALTGSDSDNFGDIDGNGQDDLTRAEKFNGDWIDGDAFRNNLYNAIQALDVGGPATMEIDSTTSETYYFPKSSNRDVVLFSYFGPSAGYYIPPDNGPGTNYGGRPDDVSNPTGYPSNPSVGDESSGGYSDIETPDHDEAFCTYDKYYTTNTYANYYYDDEIGNDLDDLIYRYFIIVLRCDFAADFISELEGSKVAIMASDGPNQADATFGNNYLFPGYIYGHTYSLFYCNVYNGEYTESNAPALAQRHSETSNADGVTGVDASSNPVRDTSKKNGIISITEAHYYGVATVNDKVSQLPSTDQDPEIDCGSNIPDILYI